MAKMIFLVILLIFGENFGESFPQGAFPGFQGSSNNFLRDAPPIDFLTSINRNFDFPPIPDFLSLVNSDAVWNFIRIPLNTTLTKNQIMAEQDAWASAQTPQVQQKYQGWKGNMTEWINRQKTKFDSMSEKLSQDAKNIYDQVNDVLMDTGITLIQECERIQSIFQNTTWGIKNELRRTMGSLPLCSIPTQQNLMRNPTFNPSGSLGSGMKFPIGQNGFGNQQIGNNGVFGFGNNRFRRPTSGLSSNFGQGNFVTGNFGGANGIPTSLGNGNFGGGDGAPNSFDSNFAQNGYGNF